MARCGGARGPLSQPVDGGRRRATGIDALHHIALLCGNQRRPKFAATKNDMQGPNPVLGNRTIETKKAPKRGRGAERAPVTARARFREPGLNPFNAELFRSEERRLGKE